MFPPTALNPAHPRGFLYQLFRPEFVINYRDTAKNKYPLSSDALSLFGIKDPEFKQQNEDIERATQQLFKACDDLALWAQAEKQRLYDAMNLFHDEMHRRGIKLCHALTFTNSTACT